MKRVILVLLVVLLAPAALAKGKPKKFVFEEQEVTGKVQRPQVQNVIARKDISDDANLKLDESFIPKLLATVEKDPF